MAKIIIAMLAISMTAFAGRNQQHNSTDTSLGDIIRLCERLEQNPQIKQFGAEVTCRGHKTLWQLKDTRDFNLRTEFIVRAEVTMKGDRYRVDEYVRRLENNPGSGECNVYEELRQDYLPVTIKLNSCAELRDLQQEGRATFCSRHLADAPFENDGLATGRTRNTCN